MSTSIYSNKFVEILNAHFVFLSLSKREREREYDSNKIGGENFASLSTRTKNIHYLIS